MVDLDQTLFKRSVTKNSSPTLADNLQLFQRQLCLLFPNEQKNDVNLVNAQGRTDGFLDSNCLNPSH